MAATGTSTIAHAFFVWLFYSVYEMGFTGIAYATAIMWVVRFLVNCCLVVFGNRFESHPAVHFFSEQTITNLGQQVKMGLNACFMIIWSWWAFDIITLMASYLSTDIIAAQTIMRSIGLVTFMIPVGFAQACGILVGNSVGEGTPALAMQYYKICMFLAIFVIILQLVVLYFGRDAIISVFTNQEQI